MKSYIDVQNSHVWKGDTCFKPSFLISIIRFRWCILRNFVTPGEIVYTSNWKRERFRTWKATTLSGFMLLDFGRGYLGFGHLKTLVFLVEFLRKISRSVIFWKIMRNRVKLGGLLAEGGGTAGHAASLKKLPQLKSRESSEANLSFLGLIAAKWI